MQNNGDKRILPDVPFLKEGTVLFLGSRNESGYRPRGKCIYLPDLVQSLDADLYQYLFPGDHDVLSAEDMERRIRELAGLGDEKGLLYRRNGVLYFHASSETPKREFRRRKTAEPQFHDILFSEVGICEELRYCQELEKRERPVADVVEAEEAPDPRVQAILDAWRKIEREFGITVEDLEVFLGYKVKLSRLSITSSNRLFLTDFDNQELKMDDLTKAIYFFFLRHPEGSRLKNLYEHEDEIQHIYSGITGRDDVAGIRSSVHNLLDPYGNALNVSMSRIKKAFRDVVGDRIARFYYIFGRSGEIRTVGIDRDLVIWEH